MIKSYITQLRLLFAEVANVSSGAVPARDMVLATNILEKQICLEMDRQVAGKSRDIIIRRHFLQLQRLILQMLGTIQSDLGVALPQESPITIFQEFLIRLLNFHQNNYPDHFDFNEMVPVVLNQKFILKVQQANPLLLAGFKSRRISEGLQTVIMSYLDFNPETTEYTFAQLKFLHYLQNAIIKLLKSIVDDDYETLLIDYLIFLNFNATLLVAYVKKGMLTKLSDIFNEQERYFFLCEEENRLQSTALKQDSVFDLSQDSLKTQLLDLITAGIVRYHRQQPIKANSASHSKDNDSYRIKMTISADVLAYLIRLFIEAGVIEAEPRSKLLVFLAEHCQTAGIGDAKLSVNSLSTKYKQVVQRTAIGVRTMLRKMVKIVDQNFEIK